MWNSLKGWLGYEDLQVESGGGNEEQGAKEMSSEKQGLFAQLKGMIGKDVTSYLSLPIYFFEPMSFLQIMCEPMQHGELLFKAAESPDSCNRLGYLTAFIISGYSLAIRLKKPFNPILGETYEYVAKDDRYQFFAEQVSHHPPVGTSICTSDSFVLEMEMCLKSKFRGNSTDVEVVGSNHFFIPKTGDVFSWKHFNTTAHNMFIGSMWIDHYGTIEIVNETTKDKCELTLNKCGWLGAGRYTFEGKITNGQGEVKLLLSGKWNEIITATKVKPDGSHGKQLVLWRKLQSPVNDWGYTPFTQQLSDITPELEKQLPKTDSRLREDRRGLQEGWQDAGQHKQRLEEKQRADRNERKEKGQHYVPRFFRRHEHALYGSRWVYQGGYWTKESRTNHAEPTHALSSAQRTKQLPESESVTEGQIASAEDAEKQTAGDNTATTTTTTTEEDGTKFTSAQSTPAIPHEPTKEQ